MSMIKRVFGELQARNEDALIGYVMAGDPTPEQTPLIADALIAGGTDILELGLPFSDPIADGPTIQAASVRSLKAGTTPQMVLEMAQRIKRKYNLPVVIMTYYNPVFRMGLNSFFNQARECSVDGVIVPDLPPEEAADYAKTAQAFGVDTIFLAAPSTSTERLKKIVACSSGFLYLVSHFGVTGEKQEIDDSTIQLIKRVLPHTKGHLPLAVGFGVSKPEHARRIVNAGADGVIVGSAFVNIVQKNVEAMDKAIPKITELARQFKTATLRSR